MNTKTGPLSHVHVWLNGPTRSFNVHLFDAHPAFEAYFHARILDYDLFHQGLHDTSVSVIHEVSAFCVLFEFVQPEPHCCISVLCCPVLLSLLFKLFHLFAERSQPFLIIFFGDRQPLLLPVKCQNLFLYGDDLLIDIVYIGG